MFKMKNAAFFLVIIFAICALLLTFTINQTKEPILEAQQKHKDALLAEIYPLASAQKMQQISDSIWLVCENKKVQGEIHKVVSDRAYADKISLLVGTKDGQIKAVRVISHSETPGLGDRIENRKSTWIDQFSLKSLKNPAIDKWAIRKHKGDFQQLSAASVTSKAVIDALKKHLIALNNRTIAPNCNK